MERLIRLNEQIDSDLMELERIRSLAYSLGAVDPTIEKVSGGERGRCRYAELINKLKDLEDEIEREVLEAVELERVARQWIASIQDERHRSYLRYKYINRLSDTEIAQKMNYSERHIKNIAKECETFHEISLNFRY